MGADDASRAAALHHLTRPKISDREPSVAGDAGKRWRANMHKVDRRLGRGSLHRLVRPVRYELGSSLRVGRELLRQRRTIKESIVKGSNQPLAILFDQHRCPEGRPFRFVVAGLELHVP